MTQALIERTTRAFHERFQVPPQHIILAPGRINLIGEHVDYNDGPVLPAAIDKYICFAIGSTPGAEEYAMAAIDLDDAISVAADAALKPTPGHWSNYPLGVLHGIRTKGKAVGGFRVAFASNIPMGAGLSSSAALSCGFGFALDRLFGLDLSRKELALIGQRAEHEFAGVRCGIMDQFASLFGQEGRVIKIDCGSLEHSYVEADLGDHALVLFDSHVKHAHLASGYNDRRHEVEEALEIIRKVYPQVQSYRHCTPEMVEALRDKLGPTGHRRAAFVVGEIQRVEAAVTALEAGELERLGALLSRTHQGLSTEYEVSCAELDFMVEATVRLEGVLGARMMGGGFGGCSINLLRRDAVDRVAETVGDIYYERFGIRMDVYPVRIAEGVHEYVAS
jgi:galactokinase